MIFGGRFAAFNAWRRDSSRRKESSRLMAPRLLRKQLADISEGDGVAARDAFQSDLLDEVSEKAIDRGGVTEVADAGEKLGSGGFASALSLQAALSVMGAESCRGAHDEHTAAMTPSVDMTAEGRLIGFSLGRDQAGAGG